MTEQEWMKCADPTSMLEFLRGKASDRKLRLFAVACCRRIWSVVSSDQHRLAEMTERYADGQATQEELLAALQEAHDSDWTAGLAFEEATGFGEDDAPEDEMLDAAVYAADNAAHAGADAATDYPAHWETNREWAVAHEVALRAQAALLRDVFGCLLFRPVSLTPNSLTWNDGTVPKIAQAIYDDRRFADMPILADALEEAGCTNADILNHCRHEGVHVRGCWCLDLLLGKE
jgi:hypothetical protein